MSAKKGRSADRLPRLKDTLQAEASDVRLDEVQVLVFVVVLLLQRADGVALEVRTAGVNIRREGFSSG